MKSQLQSLLHFSVSKLFDSPFRRINRHCKVAVPEAIRNEKGNLRYDYFLPLDDSETVLLIDNWQDQAALDIHHGLPLMGQIAALREKHDLHMKVERYVLEQTNPEQDSAFIRK